MQVSNIGINLIKSCESLSLSVYKDINGVNTVGYGHVTTMKVGETITKEKAEELLKTDLVLAMKSVDLYDGYNFSQNEYDALVSFAFNIGNIRELTNNGTRTKKEIRDKIIEYCNSNHKFVQGLYNRRLKEQQLFDGGSNMKDVLEYSKKKDGEKYLSEHFKVKEFACKDGSDKILISTTLINKLEIIRNYFNKPVTITSGYRTESYNKKVSKSTNSKHLLGTACDIKVEGVNPLIVALFCEFYLLNDSGGIGYYKSNGFTHIDIRDEKSRWVQPGNESTYRTVPKISCNA